MDSIIEISNLSYSIGENKILDDIDFEINRGDFISIVGPNDSGKTTLVKLLCGLYQSDSITVSGEKLNKDNVYEIRKKIGAVFGYSDNQFIWDKVVDELVFPLENLGYSRNVINSRLMELATSLGIVHILNKSISELSCNDKARVLLAVALMNKPDILIIDDAFQMVDKKCRNELLNYLLELHDTSDITIINVTHDLDEAIYSDKTVILNNGIVSSLGYTRTILSEQNILKYNGIAPTFPVDLSINLKYYGLMDEVMFDKNEMVMKLWQ